MFFDGAGLFFFSPPLLMFKYDFFDLALIFFELSKSPEKNNIIVNMIWNINILCLI